jgi:beta-glucosidase
MRASLTSIMLTFPPDFLWGVSTSAYQFEGGEPPNQWSEWERQGRIRSGDSHGLACDWWKSMEADLDRCRELGLTSMRISVEWARIEPEQGRWDRAAIERYVEILSAIRKRGMRPFVTLHHFTHPLWFEKQGAFLQQNSPELFATFAEFCVQHLGSVCNDWLTFNEPNVYAVFGYIFGEFPPAHPHSVRDCAVVLAHMHRAHALAYDRIHRAQEKATVGLTVNWIDFKPATNSPSDRLLTFSYDAVFNRSTLQLLNSGSLQFPFGALAPDVPEAVDKADFIGLNIYNRLHVRSGWGQDFLSTGGIFTPSHVPQGDPGVLLPYGEACPEAVIPAVKEYARLGKPIYIFENGVPDRSDRIRPWVLVQSIHHVAKLLYSGYDLRGYFHWSLIDNFEWNEGWKLRFGLYELDPVTQVRTARPSAALYKQIIRNQGVSDELLGSFSEQPATGSV